MDLEVSWRQDHMMVPLVLGQASRALGVQAEGTEAGRKRVVLEGVVPGLLLGGDPSFGIDLRAGLVVESETGLG